MAFDSPETAADEPVLSLYRLLDPEVLADPYPLYGALRERDRVQWDPFLHSWVVTGYAEVLTVLHKFSADRTPTPERLKAMGLPQLEPFAAVMVKQMLFLDGATHARLRGLCSAAFTSRRVQGLKDQIQDVADDLIDKVAASGRMDVIGDFAGHRHRRPDGPADRGSRAAQILVGRFRRDAGQFPAQSRARRPRPAQPRGHDRLFPLGHPRAAA